MVTESGMTLKEIRRAIAGEGLFRRLPVEKPDPDNIIRVFRAVIDRAILDLISSDKDAKIEAQEWLDVDSEDFIQVCELADLDTLFVFNHAIKVVRMFNNNGE